MNNNYETTFGTYVLNRNSEENNRTLQAWSSADLYILNTIKEHALKNNASVLIFNDDFGALTVALANSYTIYNYNDSLCSLRENEKNLKVNNISTDSIHFLNPEDPLPDNIDFIILKNPKSLNFLEYQLQLISEKFAGGVKVLAGDMSKNIHSSTVSLFEHYLKDVKTSLAWKKARLINGETDGKHEEINHFPAEYKPLDESFSIVNYPNLFAFGRLDPGTAFLIDNFPFVAAKKVVVDLACGDGILAVKAASKWPEASLLCVDESYLAVKSAKESFERSGFTNTIEYRVCDVLEGVEENSADLILCNPPFHDNHSLSTAVAYKMFHQSRNTLKEGGELFVVSNKHLGYEKQLSKIFSKAVIIKSNKKFSIIRAVK